MLDNFKAWWRQPFSADMSAPGWFFLVLLIVLSLAVQGIILRHIRGL